VPDSVRHLTCGTAAADPSAGEQYETVLRTTLGIALAAVIAGAAGADAASPRSPATLLARYSPIVVLHPQERFRPVAVEGFLADAVTESLTPTGWQAQGDPLGPGKRYLRLDQRFCSARDGPAAVDCYAQAEDAHMSPPVVYGAVFRRGTRIALQYWLWYVLNPYSPSVPAGELWQVHEGDWEAVTVLLDRSGKALLAGYSEHAEGARREWRRVPKRGSHPVVYVALGSHANYFSPGTHRLDPRTVDPLLISIIEQNGYQPVEHTGKGRTLRPKVLRVTNDSPPWMAFAGTWGEDQYLHAPGNAPVAFGTGPRGPAFHELWHRSVADVLGWPRG
jgi:hypothetical protein